jgi:hypothetical protein
MGPDVVLEKFFILFSNRDIYFPVKNNSGMVNSIDLSKVNNIGTMNSHEHAGRQLFFESPQTDKRHNGFTVFKVNAYIFTLTFNVNYILKIDSYNFIPSFFECN